MKKCISCKEEKLLIDFGRDIHRKDGLNPYCKLCVRKRSRSQKIKEGKKRQTYFKSYREENREILREKARIDYYLNYEKRREQSKKSYEKNKEEILKKRAEKSRLASEREKARDRQREWRKRNSTKAGQTSAAWKKRNPEKAACHSVVLWSIKSGVLKRPNACSSCQIECKPQAHHEDYTKPLDVIWVCRSCHKKKHRIYN